MSLTTHRSRVNAACAAAILGFLPRNLPQVRGENSDGYARAIRDNT